MVRLRLTDKEFDGSELNTKRSIIRQLMLVSTPRYDYSLGTINNLWTLNRYDSRESIGTDRFGDRRYPETYQCEIIDKWS